MKITLYILILCNLPFALFASEKINLFIKYNNFIDLTTKTEEWNISDVIVSFEKDIALLDNQLEPPGAILQMKLQNLSTLFIVSFITATSARENSVAWKYNIPIYENRDLRKFYNATNVPAKALYNNLLKGDGLLAHYLASNNISYEYFIGGEFVEKVDGKISAYIREFEVLEKFSANLSSNDYCLYLILINTEERMKLDIILRFLETNASIPLGDSLAGELDALFSTKFEKLPYSGLKNSGSRTLELFNKYIGSGPDKTNIKARSIIKIPDIEAE